MQHPGGHMPSIVQIEDAAERILSLRGGHLHANALVVAVIADFPPYVDVSIMVDRVQRVLANAVANKHLLLSNQIYSLPAQRKSPVLKMGQPASSRHVGLQSNSGSTRQVVSSEPDIPLATPPPPPTPAQAPTVDRNATHAPDGEVLQEGCSGDTSVNQLRLGQTIALAIGSAAAPPGSVQRPPVVSTPVQTVVGPLLSDRAIQKRILKAARRALWRAPKGRMLADDLATRTASDLLASQHITVSLTRIHDVLRRPQSGRPIQFVNGYYVMDLRSWQSLMNPATPPLLPQQSIVSHLPTQSNQVAPTSSSVFASTTQTPYQASLLPLTDWRQPRLTARDDVDL